MVQQKARKVLFFLDLLEKALECEKEKWPNIFLRLEMRGVKIPDTSKIKRNVTKEIEKLYKYYRIKLNVNEIKNEIQLKETQLKSQLKELYLSS